MSESTLSDHDTTAREPASDNIALDVLKAEARERLAEETDVDQDGAMDLDESDENHCIICLQPVVDRTVLINCAHDRMCFECIKKWAEQSRRCPLCNTPIGSHLIHSIRSQFDYQKHYLEPLRTSPPRTNIVLEARAAHRARTRRASSIAEERERDSLDRAIEKRRWVYRHGLFAKHIASNAHTRFRPNPTPQQITNSPELQSRCQMFVRRELRIWPNIDVEFLTSFILSLAKSIDIRTEAAVKLLSEFLDIGARRSPSGGTTAEHFVHELYSYLRSPFRDLPAYDAVVQYDTPDDVEAAPSLRPAYPLDDEPQSSTRQATSYDRRPRQREASDPLEASPRYARSEDSEMDMDENWAEPPPSRFKGKGKERVRDEGWRGNGSKRLRRESEERRDRRDVSREPRDYSRERGDDKERDLRRQRDSGHERKSYRRDRDYGRDRSRDDERDREEAAGSRPDRGRGYDQQRTGRPDRKRYDNRTYRHSRSRSSDAKFKSRRYRSRSDSREADRHQKRPAGWDNHFEHNHYSSVARRDHSPRPSRSQSAHRRSPAPPSHVLDGEERPPSTGKTSETEPITPLLSESTAHHGLSSATSPKSPSAPGADSVSTSDVTAPGSRKRAPRLTPLASIRLHLQGPGRSSDMRKSDDKRNDNPTTINQEVTRTTRQPSDQNSPTATNELAVATTLLPTAVEQSSSAPGTHVSPDASDKTPTPTVSYSILGAAARSRVQPQLTTFTASDSTQRGPPASTHGFTLGRTRLLERLEAARSMQNTDTGGSHLSTNSSSVPTPPEETETFIVEPVTRRIAQSATNTVSNDAIGSSQAECAEADPADNDTSPAARFDLERKLKLRARLAARKRDINAVMEAHVSPR